MRRRIPIFALSALFAVNAFAGQAQPVFKSAVEIVPVDVTVIEAGGAPVRDLSAGEFLVRIDGKPRKVVSARFYGPAERPAAPAPTVAPPAPSFADNTTSPAGRVVVFVVDLESIKPGYEKLVFDTAANLAGGLGPNDAAGLLPIPGKSIDLTRDHAAVRQSLLTLRGAAQTMWWQRRTISVSEAVAFERLDRRTMSEVIERECAAYEAECPGEVRRQAGEMLQAARARIANVLTTVATLARQLQRIAAPKTIVLISGGLPFEEDSASYFRDVERGLAESGTLLYVIQIDQPDSDATNTGRAGMGQFQSPDMQRGLAMAAGYGGAPLRHAVGTATGLFDRLRTELSNSYQLGVESLPEDANGKAHEIRVDVTRPGLEVRSRRAVIAVAQPPSVIQRLVSLIAQPVDTPDLPIALAAYTVRGEAAESLKTVVFAEIARGSTVNPPVRYAVTILDEQRRSVFQSNGDAETLPGATVARATFAAQMAPGKYRVRFAAVDGGGRGGTVELPIAVGLRAAGAVMFSDLLLGVAGDTFRPAIACTPGQRISGLLELYAADPQVFSTVTADFELRRAGDDDVVVRQAAALLRTDLERRWIAQAGLPTSSLPPGSYVVSAILSVGRRPVGKVSRQIDVRP